MARIIQDHQELAREIRKTSIRRETRRHGQRRIRRYSWRGMSPTSEDSRTHGDILVVGLNSDESVRQLKGDDRPICREAERFKGSRVATLCGLSDGILARRPARFFCEPSVPTCMPKEPIIPAENVPERAISDELGIETYDHHRRSERKRDKNHDQEGERKVKRKN